MNIAKKVAEEDELLGEKFGINTLCFNLFEEKTISYFFAERTFKNELENFLDNLSQIEITLIASVMYAGRDYSAGSRCHTLEEMITNFSKTESSDLKLSIMEKGSLAVYLQKGIQAYS